VRSLTGLDDARGEALGDGLGDLLADGLGDLPGEGFADVLAGGFGDVTADALAVVTDVTAGSSRAVPTVKAHLRQARELSLSAMSIHLLFHF
jgi:hypothetical protein